MRERYFRVCAPLPVKYGAFPSQAPAAERMRVGDHDGDAAPYVDVHAAGGRRVTGPGGPDAYYAEDPVEYVAREIQLRGMTAPAVMFLEASRPYQALGSQAMLFFDPVLRGLFGGESVAMQRVMADDAGIERLIERLEEIDEEPGCDA